MFLIKCYKINTFASSPTKARYTNTAIEMGGACLKLSCSNINCPFLYALIYVRFFTSRILVILINFAQFVLPPGVNGVLSLF